MFGVETFLLPDGSVQLNEVAPRPHNSGHYTIEACSSSQFEAHLRAVLGWPQGDTSLRVGASIMLNILGEAEGEEGERRAHQLMARAYGVPGASVHWYGKAGVAPQRKIGHLTIVGRDNDEVRRRLRLIDAGECMPAPLRCWGERLAVAHWWVSPCAALVAAASAPACCTSTSSTLGHEVEAHACLQHPLLRPPTTLHRPCSHPTPSS